MENNRNIIEWCNNTHQGAPHTGKQTCACASDLGNGSHITCVVLLYVFVMRSSHISLVKKAVWWTHSADPSLNHNLTSMSHRWCQIRHPVKIAPMLQTQSHFTYVCLQTLKCESAWTLKTEPGKLFVWWVTRLLNVLWGLDIQFTWFLTIISPCNQMIY